ncbi:GIDE domain-containing protein [Psychroserpens jangbogonensis]|uniref:GIDE domain-containing protein n=1 Tax=Psychroserpens jangbogonensis TaxID=1484460 RepID=UPI00053E8D94|nr:GIDE domain-containing protein [Psychroserpens jangbogonensis]
MSEPIIIACVFSVVGIIIFCTYYFSRKNVIIRTLSKIPHKPASSLKTNQLSKVSGKALHVKEPLIAPYSKRKCVFYQIVIQQKVNTGKSSHWKTIVDEERSQEFFIQTKNDFVIVSPEENPKNYKCYLVKDQDQNSGTFNNPTQKFIALLQHYHIDHTTLFGFNKRLRYKEGVIEIGEEITVAGIAKWKTLSEPMPEYPYSKIATLESVDKQKIIITDLPEIRHKRR